MDYQNNSSYIFKEEGKHSLGATALSAFYTRCLLFNGSSYLGNENESKSGSYFPIEQMSVSRGAKGHTTMLSHHQFKIKRKKKKRLSGKECFKKKKVFFVNACIERYISWTSVVSDDLRKIWGEKNQ